jgi:hypothetical protein
VKNKNHLSLLFASLVLALPAWSKPKPIALQLTAKSAKAQNTSYDSTVKGDCKSSDGQTLEFCQIGTPVEFSRNERGEYCTQYTSGSKGRMWDPL